MQNSYSLLERGDEADVLPLCERHGLGYTPFSPLAGGWLTGKYRPGEPYPEGSRMTLRPGPYRDFARDGTFSALASLDEAARARGVDMATLALAWLLADERVTSIVVGPRRPAHLEPAIAALERAPLGRRARRDRSALPAMSVLVLGEADVARLLPMEECIEAMAEALAALQRGDMEQPLRFVVRPAEAGSLMGLMPAYRSRPEAAYALKAVCVFPGNPARGLDAHQGAVLLFDGETGVLRAAVNASAITAIRTAAVSAVATRLLAREDASVLAVLGAGVQARSHLQAMAAVRDFEQARVWSRTPGARRSARGRRRRALPGRAVESAEEALRGADVVCTTTSSPEPVVRRAGWRPART